MNADWPRVPGGSPALRGQGYRQGSPKENLMYVHPLLKEELGGGYLLGDTDVEEHWTHPNPLNKLQRLGVLPRMEKARKE